MVPPVQIENAVAFSAYMFVAIVIVCGEFFVMALETKSSKKFINLTMLFLEQR